MSRILFSAFLLASLLPAQQPDPDLLKSIDQVLGRGDRAPTIDEILGDTLTRLRKIDGMSTRAAAARLRETEAELRLYEGLLKQVKAGLLVDIPRVGNDVIAASPEALAAERQRVDDLTRQLRDAEADVKRLADSRPASPAAPQRATLLADAMLDVIVDVPEPPSTRTGPGRAADPANLSLALFHAGDYSGALEALGQLDAKELTPELLFRRARSLDQLGRVAEARAAYEAVVAAEKDGPYARQASWMLRLARTREQVAGTMEKPVAPSQGDKKK